MSEDDKTNESKRKTQKLGMAGSKIAHYTLVRELGHGGQGYVYLARDENLGRDVALKILHNMGALNPKTRLRFVREAETASKLTHPGLCAVHEFGEYEGMPFIAMQFVEGVPLSDKISTAKDSAKTEGKSFVAFDTTTSAGAKEEKTPTETGKGSNSKTRINGESPQDRDAIMKVVKMIEDAARALHAAHEESLIHRDIKPANIILANDGRPVILDFGLARDEESDQATLTMTGDLMGTPAYMSPEQITRSSIRVDRRSDVYSLGVTLFECLTLERPFSAPNREKLYQAIMFQDPPNARKLNPAISDDLRVIVEMALEKDPDRRYQTAEELAEDLRRLREYKPIHAKPAGPWVKTVRWVQRNPAVAVASVVVFLALVAVAGVFYVKEKDASESRDKALLAQKDAETARDEAQTARDLAKSESEQKTIALTEKDTALKAEKDALAEKSKALAEKSKALADYDRLADVKRLEKAIAESDDLYPPSPELVEKLALWQKTHGDLVQKLGGHREFLASLRAKALPYTDAERARDFAAEIAARKSAEESLKKTNEDLEKAEDEAAKKKLESQKKSVIEQIEKLNKTIAGQRSWDFGDQSALSLKHDIMTGLVKDLGAFAESKMGAIASITERLTASREIAQKTITDHLEAWTACRERIKKSKHYKGLDLKPQLGLIPLGSDPDSGLEEFLHHLTNKGEVPKRDKNNKILVTDDLGIVLVLIPGGTFLMGSQKEDPKKPNFDPGSRGGEGPVNEVELETYFLSKYEMTQAQWQRSFADNPSRYVDGNFANDKRFKAGINPMHPVEQVSWIDAQRFLPRIDLILPTEAEWERAARANEGNLVFSGTSKVEELKDFANIKGQETKTVGFTNLQAGHTDNHILHAPVGSYQANGFGLHDMTGNVWEWCFDGFFGYDTQAGDRGKRGGSRSSASRVIRGGSFYYPAAFSRVAYRVTYAPEIRFNYLGVRPSRIVTL